MATRTTNVGVTGNGETRLGKQVTTGRFTEIGRTGISVWGGRVREEYLPQLTAERGRRVFRQMQDNDAVVGGLLLAIELLIRQLDWRVEPRPESANPADAQRWADYVNTCLHDMSMTWEAFLSAVLSFLPYGWSFHEIVYKLRGGDVDDPTRRSQYDDGMIGWRKLPIRSQESLIKWEWDDASGAIQGMTQTTGSFSESTTIPMEKGLLFRTTAAKGNPEGRSILRTAYRAWYFKNRIEEVEGIGIERDLTGMPVGWVPVDYLDQGENADPDKAAVRQAMEQVLRDIKRDDQEFVLWPLAYDENGNKEFDLTLMTTGGRRQFDTDAVIARYDQRILLSSLAQFLILAQEKVGSYALSAAHQDFFSMAIGAWADEIASVMNEFAIPRLVKLNGATLDVSPVLVHDEIKEIDLDALGNFLFRRAGAGDLMFPNHDLTNFLNRLAGLPEVEGAEQEL